jgi:hypothetical protein
MNYKRSCYFGLWSDFILSGACFVEHLLYLSMVGLLACKLGTLSVGCAFTLCSVFFGRLGGFAPSRFAFSFLCCLIMNKFWNILCWNVRGLNDKDKWSLLRNKIEESGANISVFRKPKESLLIFVF